MSQILNQILFSILVYLSWLQLPTAHAQSYKTINVTVPDDAFQHDDVHTIYLLIRWYEICLFYLVNFVAHAVTIKSLPGERLSLVISDVIIVLFFPYYGILRGIEAILRCGICSYQDELKMAARSGALCTVIRTPEWSPQTNRAIWGVRTPEERNERQHQPIVVENDHLEIINLDSTFWSRTIHGLHFLPPVGYAIAILPSNADVIPRIRKAPGDLPYDSTITRSAGMKGTKELKISSTVNIVKSIVAIAQIVFAIATLIRTTEGNQIRLFGFAAFGWTVLPFLIMSAFNVFGNLLTPDYPALYLVDSFELQEARVLAQDANPIFDWPGFDGIVGKLVQDENLANLEPGRFRNSPVSDSSLSDAIVEDEILRPPGQGVEIEFVKGTRTLSIISTSRSIAPSPPAPQLLIPQCTEFKRTGLHVWKPEYAKYATYVTCFVVGAIPYIIIFVLTKGEPGESTFSQRFFIQFWIAVGVFVGANIAPMGRYGFEFPKFLNRLLHHIFGGETALFITLFICYNLFIYALPAIGGYISVGLMLKEYGSCVTY